MLVAVGRSMSQFLKYIGLTGGVSMWLLARTASRMWARCCNARAVRTASHTWTGCCIALQLSRRMDYGTNRMVKTGWFLGALCVCHQAVCFDKSVRIVRDTPIRRRRPLMVLKRTFWHI